MVRHTQMSLIISVILVTAALVAVAAPLTGPDLKLQQDLNLIGSSVLIVSGTLIEGVLPPVPKTAPSQAILEPVTLRVDKVIRGKCATDTVEFDVSLNPRYKTVQVDGRPSYTIDGWQPGFTRGERYVAVLTLGQTGLAFQSFLPVAEADALTARVAEYPLQMTLKTPDTPVAFGTAMDLTYTVKNVGNKPITLSGVYCTGFYPSRKMNDRTRVTAIADTMRPMKDGVLAQAPLLKPGEEATYAATVRVDEPPSWAIYDPAALMQTSLVLRAYVVAEVPGGANPVPWSAGSPYQAIIVGHPIPEVLQ